MMDHSEILRTGLVNQPKGACPEMSPIYTLSLIHGEWSVHGDLFINKICNILRSDLGRRKVIGDEGEFDAGQVAYGGAK